MADLIPTISEKCQGAMLASAIGDALGWPNERRQNKIQNNSPTGEMFPAWTRTIRFPHWHQEQILPGEYSDDTQLTLAVARSILTENWEFQFAMHELPYWLSYERGGGKAIKNAAKACRDKTVLWKQKNVQEYFDAGGNGVTMRILPHVVSRAHDTDVNGLMIEVIQDGIITHGHPRALVGALCFAYALNYLLNKEDVLKFGELVSAILDAKATWGILPEDNTLEEWRNVAITQSGYDYMTVWYQTVDQMIDRLHYIKNSLEKGILTDDNKALRDLECFSKANGAGDVATLAAIYLTSKYANNPILGVKIPALAKGMDTDTVASMTGALLGMLCGTSWIPNEWKMVQDYTCIVKITELLLANQKLESTKAYIKQEMQDDKSWSKTPMGMARLVESYSIQSKNADVIIRKIMSALGQTIYVKEYHEKEKGSAKEKMAAPSDGEVLDFDGKLSFSVNQAEISELLKCQSLGRKTFSKILQIVDALMLQESPENIAKKLNVDLESVKTISRYIA